MATSSSEADAFVRDAPTWMAYGALGAYTFWLYAFGPAVALLRAELHFSYTVLSVYSAAWAGGSVLAGATFARLAATVSRKSLLAISAGVTVGGAALFALAHSIPVTLLGGAVMGAAGTMIQLTTQSLLADHHGTRSGQALIEMNAGAGLSAVLAPLALGLSQTITSSWRAAMAVPAVALLVLAFVYRNQNLPTVPTRQGRGTGGSRSRLSITCWSLSLLVAIGIGVEFAVVYFGAELLTAADGLPTTASATAMSIFYVGILLGRIAGIRLTRRPGRSATLLALSLTVTLAGLVTLWLTADPVPAVLGLFVGGLGIANQFPLALAMTLAAAPGQTDAANALTQFLGGLLVLSAPFLLGLLADTVGLTGGFSVAPILTAISGLLLFAALRGTRARIP